MKNKKLLGDVPVGETFEFAGETYKVVKPKRGQNFICRGCAFDRKGFEVCTNFACDNDQREDKKEVYFVKVK